MYGRRPLTKLETGIYAGVVGVFLVVFANYMLSYMEIAERVAMEATLINTTTAINLRVVHSALGQTPALADITRRNPFEVAGASPPNLSRGNELSALGSGQWAYDAERSELVYLPRLHSGLQTADGQPALRFRLVRAGPGFALVASAPFRWE